MLALLCSPLPQSTASQPASASQLSASQHPHLTRTSPPLMAVLSCSEAQGTGPSVDLPRAERSVRICVVWCPRAKARGAAALPDSVSDRRRRANSSRPGQPRAWRLPSGGQSSTGKGAGCGERRKCRSYLGFSPFAPQLSPNFPVAGRPSSPSASVSAPKLLAPPAPCRVLSRFSPLSDPTWAAPRARTPFTPPAAQQEQGKKLTRGNGQGEPARECEGEREKERRDRESETGRARHTERTAFTL